MDTLLKLENVSKVFTQDSLKLKVLDRINLQVKKGEFVALMGPSGSGKSTLMYIMGCLDTPTYGDVIFESQKVSQLSEKELAKIRNQKIGFVFQTFNLLPRTSALTNVMLPLIYADRESGGDEQRARQLLEKLGLAERLDHSPNQLSGGEQQRVAIARALVTKPSLILADEPTGNLDSKSGKEIMEIFKKLNKEGNTVVVVTHDPQVAKYAQRIIKIQDGKISGNH